MTLKKQLNVDGVQGFECGRGCRLENLKMHWTEICFKLETRQPRELWEVLAGVAERYAAGLIGMKAFVAPPLHHMKMKCGIRCFDPEWTIRNGSGRLVRKVLHRDVEGGSDPSVA